MAPLPMSSNFATPFGTAVRQHRGYITIVIIINANKIVHVRV